MGFRKGFGKEISTYYLTEQQIEKLIDFAPDLKHRLLIRLLKVTAGRRFEIQSLRIEDIDWERKQIRLRRGKGGKKELNATPDKRRERPFDIDDVFLLKDLKEYIARRIKGYIMQSNNRKEGMNVSTMNRMTKKCGILADVKNPDPRKKWINPHLFRHTYGRRKDIDLPVKQAILGHRDAYITMQMYGGLRTSDAIDIVREAKQKNKDVNVSLDDKHDKIEHFCHKHGISVKEYFELVRDGKI